MTDRITRRRPFGVHPGIWTLTFLTLTGCGSPIPAPPPKPIQTAITQPAPEDARQKMPTDYYHLPGTPRPKPYQVFGKWYRPLAHAKGFRQQGLASWYGEDFHGKPTATGERYDMYGISAAHKILPLGTWVRVTSLKNGKTIDLPVNDRGPFVAGRIIDLSYGAAKALGILGPGTGPVEIEALGFPKTARAENAVHPEVEEYQPADYTSGRFFIQVGAFGERKNAEKLAATLIGEYGRASVQPTVCRTRHLTLYRVLVGHLDSLDEARNYEEALKSKGFTDAFTIAE